jgi:hypothetical protein
MPRDDTPPYGLQPDGRFRLRIARVPHTLVSAARILASQENCDTEEFDLLIAMADRIEQLEADVLAATALAALEKKP